MLDDHRVVTFENLFHQPVVRQAMISCLMSQGEQRSSCIRKHWTGAVFQKHDIASRV